MSDGTVKSYTYKCARRQIELTFKDESHKLKFESSLNNAKKGLGCQSIKDTIIQLVLNWDINRQTSDNGDGPDAILSQQENGPTVDATVPNSRQESPTTTQRETNVDSRHGFTSSCSPATSTHVNFICQFQAINKLCASIAHHQAACKHLLSVQKTSQSGHVGTIILACLAGHQIQWNSSEVMDTNFVVNYQMMVSYICSGMIPIQYDRICDFSHIGKLTKYFRSNCLVRIAAIIDLLKRQSIFRAKAEEGALTNQRTIGIMTDARHACRKNSFHTDHVALGVKTHKVVDIQHVTKEDDHVSQRHEKVGVARMYAEFERQDINVDVHVHDNNSSVNKFIREKEGDTRNCNERWHATKPITRELNKIGLGAQKWEGIKWHIQLQDKGLLIRNHVYWALDHCNDNVETLRGHIDNCVEHFQNRHDKCEAGAACKKLDYVPSFTVVTDPAAVQSLVKCLKGLTVYKQAANYVLSMDTYFVESYNNVCLIYLDKRIHYKNQMYEVRSGLTVLDWNEHVGRAYTSRSKTQRVQNGRRILGKKAYKAKTYKFVQDIWDLLEEVVNNPSPQVPPTNPIAPPTMIEFSDSEEEEEQLER